MLHAGFAVSVLKVSVFSSSFIIRFFSASHLLHRPRPVVLLMQQNGKSEHRSRSCIVKGGLSFVVG